MRDRRLRWLPLVLPALLNAGCKAAVSFGECASPWPAHVARADAGVLHQEGKRLVDAHGQPRTLRSVTLGGWLLWAGWIWGSEVKLRELSHGAEGQVLARLEELYGPDAPTWFSEAVWSRYVTDGDFKAIADAGFDSVRLSINHRFLEAPGG